MKYSNIILGGLVAFAGAAVAMPTQEQVKQVQPLVLDLMKDDQVALKSGKKTRVEVAEAAMALADKADSEAAKLLLMKGAFNLYVRAGEFDKAIETLQSLQAAIPDIPLANMANIIEASLRVVSRKNGGQLYRLLDETKTRMRYTSAAKKMEKALKESPNDRQLRTKLAEHYVYLGKWDKALENFTKGVDAKAAQVAKDEQDGAKEAKAIADFWWVYPDNRGEELVKPFKQHAAVLYLQAVASGKLVGLNKVQADRRIEEAKVLGEVIYAASERDMVEIKAFDVELPMGEKLDFVMCPAGEFMMGWPADEVKKLGGYAEAFTEHKVKITRPFLMSTCVITRGQWGAITGNGETGGDPKKINDKGDVLRFFEKLTHILGGRIPRGYEVRFPTEAEHEYALKASDATSVFSRYHIEKDVEKNIFKGTNTWGLSNMRTTAWFRLCMQDTVGSQENDVVRFAGGTISRLKYESVMVNPIWDMGNDMHITWEGGWCYKGAYGKCHGLKEPNVMFHVVIAPRQDSLNRYPRANGALVTPKSAEQK